MTMALTKRKTSQGNGRASLSGMAESPKKASGSVSLPMICAVVALMGAVVYASNSFLAGTSNVNTANMLRQIEKGGTYFSLTPPDIQLWLNLGTETTISSLGPYEATLHATKKACPNPGFWLRMEGDALDTVFMTQNDDHWHGAFSFPVAGSYQLVAIWQGCDNKHPPERIELMKVDVTGESSKSLGGTNSLYPQSAWLSSKKFKDIPSSTPYVWHNPAVPTSDANIVTTAHSAVSKEGAIFVETGFHQFKKLSNYELVCWVGSESAAGSRDVFLDEKRTLFVGQRPFKFHIYPSTNFVHPAEDWEKSNEERFRKCKHILVSIDEIKTPLSQKEYADQVTTFLNHLLKAFPDETFPIWMYIVNESPMKPTNCLPPYILPRTSDHPCNDVLRDLFAQNTFPERLHLLDNTAITLPQLGDNVDDVKAAIALRIFVLVGKKVAEWREVGQQGLIDGLHRGDKVEPNFELVAYEGWK